MPRSLPRRAEGKKKKKGVKDPGGRRPLRLARDSLERADQMPTPADTDSNVLPSPRGGERTTLSYLVLRPA
jgi:hypothetical protein